MKKSENINELAKAVCTFQSALRSVGKDSTVKHTKFTFKYSDLETIWEAIRSPLTSQGLSVIQEAKTSENKAFVSTLLMHSSGQWIEFDPLELPVHDKESYKGDKLVYTKPDAHAFGSAISYAKRYALGAALQVVSSDEDDDAKTALPNGNGHKNGNGNYITPEQIRLLNEALDKCPDDYVENVKSSLKQMGIASFDKITVELYDRIIKTAEIKKVK